MATSIPNVSLSSRALLVDLDVQTWSGHKYDRSVSDEVAKSHGADADAGRYNKRLIEKGAFVELRSISTRAHNAHYRLTVPWADRGDRLLSAELLDEYTRTMRGFEKDYNDAADRFAAKYPQYVNNASKNNGTMFKPSEYPTQAEVRDMFSFGYTIMPVPDSADIRVSVSEIEVARIAKAVESTINARIEAGVQDVYGRIVEVVEHMATSLREYTVTADGVEHPFRDSLVGNVRDLASILPALNVMCDPALESLSARVQAELCHYGPKQLRASEETRNEVAAAAESILKDARDFFA